MDLERYNGEREKGEGSYHLFNKWCMRDSTLDVNVLLGFLQAIRHIEEEEEHGCGVITVVAGVG